MNFSCHDYKLQSTYDDLKTLLWYDDLIIVEHFDLNYRTPVYVNLFIWLKWYIRCRAVLLPLELMSVSGNK